MSDRLEELVKRLPKDVGPERDLWPGLAARLRPRRRSFVPAGLRLAAGTLVAAAALGAYFALRPASPPAGGPRPSVAATAPAAGADAVIARDLDAVDETIARVRDALRRDPDNPVLYDFLEEAYRQKNRLMLERTQVALTRSYPS